MHRVIAGTGPAEMADHKKPLEMLDYRRQNVRVCTNAQNQQNIGARGGKSAFKGVSWNAEKRRWKVAFRCDEMHAAKAYAAAVAPLAGEFARLNFPSAA
jgi:hypothetical protein